MFGKFITSTATDGVTQASTVMEYYSKNHLGSIVAITDGREALNNGCLMTSGVSAATAFMRGLVWGALNVFFRQ